MTATGSNIGTVTMWPPTTGMAVIVSVEAAWNIGVCSRNVSPRAYGSPIRQWYRFIIWPRWFDSTPLGRPVVPPVYMSTTGSDSSPSSGITGSAEARKSA